MNYAAISPRRLKGAKQNFGLAVIAIFFSFSFLMSEAQTGVAVMLLL